MRLAHSPVLLVLWLLLQLLSVTQLSAGLLVRCRAPEMHITCAEMSDCSLWLASRQVRIHRATASSLYLRVASGPIMEHSSGLSFGPCPALPYPSAQADLDAAQLGQEGALWAQVQDFGWLRSTPSPHWCAFLYVLRRQLGQQCYAAAADSVLCSCWAGVWLEQPD